MKVLCRISSWCFRSADAVCRSAPYYTVAAINRSLPSRLRSVRARCATTPGLHVLYSSRLRTVAVGVHGTLRVAGSTRGPTDSARRERFRSCCFDTVVVTIGQKSRRSGLSGAACDRQPRWGKTSNQLQRSTCSKIVADHERPCK